MVLQPTWESALDKHLVIKAAQIWEGKTHTHTHTHTHDQVSPCPCGIPENLNLSGLVVGNAKNSGAALDSTPKVHLETEQYRSGNHIP